MVPIILNPDSGRGVGRNHIPAIERQAKALGWDGEIHILEPEEDLAAVLTDYFSRHVHRHVIIGGGDGTLAASLPTLVRYKATLGILPIGTGNLIALNLGIPKDTAKALKVALQGRPRPVDIGRVNGRYFSVACGMGWDGAVMKETHPGLKRRLGLLAYLFAALKHLGHPRDTYRLRIDGQIVGRFSAKTVMVGNMAAIAPRVRLFPDSTPDDGLLDVAVVRSETLFGWLRLCLNTLLDHRERDREALYFRGHKVIATALGGDRLVQVDGDYFSPTDRLEATILPGALKIMVPAAPEPPSHPRTSYHYDY